jgi:hypothetical protein
MHCDHCGQITHPAAAAVSHDGITCSGRAAAAAFRGKMTVGGLVPGGMHGGMQAPPPPPPGSSSALGLGQCAACSVQCAVQVMVAGSSALCAPRPRGGGSGSTPPPPPHLAAAGAGAQGRRPGRRRRQTLGWARSMRRAPARRPIDAPCTQRLRHGDPIHAQERLTEATAVALRPLGAPSSVGSPRPKADASAIRTVCSATRPAIGSLCRAASAAGGGSSPPPLGGLPPPPPPPPAPLASAADEP